MSLAEQKVALMELVVNADAETTDVLLSFAQHLTGEPVPPSPEVVAAYEKRADDFYASGEKGISAEESIARLRQMLP